MRSAIKIIDSLISALKRGPRTAKQLSEITPTGKRGGKKGLIMENAMAATRLDRLVIWFLGLIRWPLYRVFLLVSDNCWRETLPKRAFLRRQQAIKYSQELARERGSRLWDGAGFSVSTHRDGVEYWRSMCSEFHPVLGES